MSSHPSPAPASAQTPPRAPASAHPAPPLAAPPAAPKVGFVLLSPRHRPEPSTRVAALNLFPHLRAAGFDPQVVYEPETNALAPDLPDLAGRLAREGFAAVAFQKVRGPGVLAQARALREHGIRTLYINCDFVAADLVEATDATVCITDYLRSLYPAELQPRVHVVHDGIERPDVVKQAWHAARGQPRAPLRAVLVTSSQLHTLPVLGAVPPWLRVDIVGRYAERRAPLRRLREIHWAMAAQSLGQRLDYLGFLMAPRIRCLAWHPERVYEHLSQADIGIIPIQPAAGAADVPTAPWRLKSENRLTLKMAVGLPVVATPIPAYEPIIEHGVNGFFARTPADWRQCLERLRDPDLRRAMGERARASVLQRYGQDEQARRFVAVLRGMLNPVG